MHPAARGRSRGDAARCWWRISTTATTSAVSPSAACFNGTLRLGDEVAIVKLDGSFHKTKITKLYSFEGLKRVDETIGRPGDVLADRGCGGNHDRRDDHQRGNSGAAAAYPDRRADDRDDVHHQHVAVRRT